MSNTFLSYDDHDWLGGTQRGRGSGGGFSSHDLSLGLTTGSTSSKLALMCRDPAAGSSENRLCRKRYHIISLVGKRRPRGASFELAALGQTTSGQRGRGLHGEKPHNITFESC